MQNIINRQPQCDHQVDHSYRVQALVSKPKDSKVEDIHKGHAHRRRHAPNHRLCHYKAHCCHASTSKHKVLPQHTVDDGVLLPEDEHVAIHMQGVGIFTRSLTPL